MTVVGIIPARAGSKRLPGKALLPLAGRPLLAHTCTAAVDSGVLSAVYVNTDCPRIAAAGQAAGVECPALRPAALAADDTPTRDSNLFLLDVLTRRGERYDAVMVLQPTSPLRTAEDIRAAWALFREHAPCEVYSLSPVAPQSWLGLVKSDGGFERWQGAQTVYRLNGAIYIHPWAHYVAGRPATPVAYVMPATRGVDIDTRDDLALAEFLLARGPTSGPAAREVQPDHEIGFVRSS